MTSFQTSRAHRVDKVFTLISVRTCRVTGFVQGLKYVNNLLSVLNISLSHLDDKYLTLLDFVHDPLLLGSRTQTFF